MIKFWWRSGSPSGYGDCFPDSSLFAALFYCALVFLIGAVYMVNKVEYISRDTESVINRLRCATLQCRACMSRRRHSNYDVITSPAQDRQPRQTCLGGGMHCPSTASYGRPME